MRKLAILAFIYLFCLEIAYADPKKNIEQEYLRSVEGTSKECIVPNSNNDNYKKIINKFEKTFEQHLKNSSVNLDELSYLYYCYAKLEKRSKFLSIIDRLIDLQLITFQKNSTPRELFVYYASALGLEIINDEYKRNTLSYYNQIDNFINMGKFLVNQNYNDELFEMIIYSKIENLYLNENYQDKYLQFLNIALQHFKNLKNNNSLLQIMNVKLKFLSNDLNTNNCFLFFTTDLKPVLKIFVDRNNLKFLIDQKVYETVNSIYNVANICISRHDIKKSFYHTLEHIELMEFLRENIKEIDFNKKISDKILDQLLYLHQISGSSGLGQQKNYENYIKEKLNTYASTKLKKMEVEIELIRQIWEYRKVELEEEKYFVKKINDGINFLNVFSFEDYRKDTSFSEFTSKEMFQANLDEVKFKYLNLYSKLLFVFGKYVELVVILEQQIQFLENEKNKYSSEYLKDLGDFSNHLPSLYTKLLNSQIILKNWNGAEQTIKKGLLYCDLLPLKNYQCYSFRLVSLKNWDINKKEDIIKIIDDINFFYKDFINDKNYPLYTQDQKDRFENDYLVHKVYGLVSLKKFKVIEANFKEGPRNINNYICDIGKSLKKLVNTSKNKDINNTKNTLAVLAINDGGLCEQSIKPSINDEYFKLVQKAINEYKSYIDINQYSDFLQKTAGKDIAPLLMLELISFNKNHPEYQKLSREIFKMLQSEEAKFYFKSKNNLINKKFPGLADKINEQNILRIQYENLISEMYNNENKIFNKEFVNKKNMIEKKIIILKEEIKKNFPTLNKFNFKETVSVEEIQDRLSNDDALIYLKNASSAMTIVITKNDYQINVKNFSNLHGNVYQKFKADLKEKLLKSVSNKNSSVETNSIKIFGATIYQQFLKQIEPYIKNKKNLYFITDEYMSDIPFELLVVNKEVYKDDAETLLKEGFAAEYLIEKFNIKYLPNTASLMELKKSTASQSEKANFNFLGVGNPKFSKSSQKLTSLIIDLNSRGFLKDVDKINSNYQELPYTEKELYTLKEIFKKNTILSYTSATESNVKTLNLKKFNIINFATHAEVSGSFNGFNEPFLVLTPPKISNEIDDGLLTSSEISSLDLNADMVILSACDTSSKKNEYASGFSGLISSFLLAGANSVVATHWPIEDSAGYLLITETMKKFINSNLDFSEALRKTKIEFINGKYNNKFKNPFFWAPYVYVGL